MSVSPEPTEDSSIDTRAHRLWEAAVQTATEANIPITETRFGSGYTLKGENAMIEVAIKVWPNLASKGRRTSATKSFVSNLTTHLRKSGNVQRLGSNWFVRSFYSQRANRIVQHPILGTLGPPPEVTILERSKTVWQRARNYCATKNRPTRTVETVVFWECDKPLAYFIGQAYPDLTAYEGGRQPIYDFLRSTANGVNIGGRQDDEMLGSSIHSWLIRDEWNEGGGEKIFVSINREPTARDRREARLSPHEAGEDREPLPVVITKATQEAVNDMTDSTPNAAPAAPEQPTEALKAVDNGDEYRCTYPGCGRSFASPHNLGRHTTSQHKHDPDGHEIRKTALDVVRDTFIALEKANEENARLKAQVVEQEALLTMATEDDGSNARIESIRTILKRVAEGQLAPFRALAEIEDALG